MEMLQPTTRCNEICINWFPINSTKKAKSSETDGVKRKPILRTIRYDKRRDWSRPWSWFCSSSCRCFSFKVLSSWVSYFISWDLFPLISRGWFLDRKKLRHKKRNYPRVEWIPERLYWPRANGHEKPWFALFDRYVFLLWAIQTFSLYTIPFFRSSITNERDRSSAGHRLIPIRVLTFDNSLSLSFL